MSLDKPQGAQVHRPGVFKQTNKQHKHGRHRSKGSISVATKGKVSVKTLSKKNKQDLSRQQRRHQAEQIRKNKRLEAVNEKRFSAGALECSPLLVGIVPLNKSLDTGTVLGLLKQCDPEAVVTRSPSGVTHVTCKRFKKKFAFITPPVNNEFALLDSLKICDCVLFVVSASIGVEDYTVVDDWGENILLSIFSQGLPTPAVVLTDLESIAPKKRNDEKQAIQKLINKWLPDEKIIPLGSNTDSLNLLRKIGDQKRKPVIYRDRRFHMYAEDVEYIPDETGALGTLKISGYSRGTPLSVNNLIHIPGMGDFQMSQIDAPPDPYSIEKNRNKNNSMDKDKFVKILEKSDPGKQESLDRENIPDPLDAEQTWPTEEEMELAEKEVEKKVKKVPKGWSDYQAAWIPDDDTEFLSDNEEEEEDENENSDNEYMDAKSEEKSDSEQEEYLDTVTESEAAVNDDKYDQEMDIEAERKELEKLKSAKVDRVFPDEVDTPLDQPARVRFQKYRGLESFRTSPWDPKENLPSDYARIFQFQNFDRTKKRVLKDLEEATGVFPGWYTTIHVKDVPQLTWNTFKTSNSPLVVISLLPHERKMSVSNVVLKRTPNYNVSIKSKERLIFQVGYRRFVVNPIFSQHTNGQKHKFERYFHPSTTAVATFYAPIQFPPAPVLCYKETTRGLVLVATGSLLSCNPDRIVLKRIVLSGHPFKIYRKTAVIRFLFFNRDDIIYFKPVKLRTKLGRIGHIKEPLGTHGHVKCVFDGQLKSQDTVLLNLYKRVFPKWTYEDLVFSNENTEKMDY